MQTSEYIAKIKESKDLAYWERNQLVALLSKMFPSWLEVHPREDKEWDSEWRNIVFMDLPVGQASWHIHDRDLENFKHLNFRLESAWDGHTTEEKYKRLESFPISKENCFEGIVACQSNFVETILKMIKKFGLD